MHVLCVHWQKWGRLDVRDIKPGVSTGYYIHAKVVYLELNNTGPTGFYPSRIFIADRNRQMHEASIPNTLQASQMTPTSYCTSLYNVFNDDKPLISRFCLQIQCIVRHSDMLQDYSTVFSKFQLMKTYNFFNLSIQRAFM